VDVRREIEELVAIGRRGPGTDAERRAARHLEGRLRDLGRAAAVEHVDAWPNWPISYALFVVLAIVGSALSVAKPALGGAFVLVATLAVFADATSLLTLPRRVAGRRASQNVVSTEQGAKPGTLVLVAHYDAGRTGLVFARWVQERRALLGRTMRRPIGPFEPLLWAEVVLLACCVLRLVGVSGPVLTTVQFVCTAGLIIAVALLIDVAVSAVVPGANDNASGVAVALALADRHGGRLEHFHLCVLFTGAQEALSAGMRAFMRGRRRQLDRQRAVFLNLDEVGAGTVRFTRREGTLVALRSHDQLVQLCEQIVDDDEEGRAFAARGLVPRVPTDAYVAQLAGFPAITVCCRDALDYTPEHHRLGDVPARVDDRSLERAIGFCSELIRRVDADLGPGLRREPTVLREPAS
jgi:hypothetical protein